MNNENINNNIEQEQLISFKHAKRAKKYTLKSDKKVRTFKYSDNFLPALLSCYEQARLMQITDKTLMNVYSESLKNVENIDLNNLDSKPYYISDVDENMERFLKFEENVEERL